MSQNEVADHSMLWGFDGPELPGELLDRARNGEVVGLTLFRNFNVLSPEQVLGMTSELREAMPDGLHPLVAIDQEGGQFLGLTGSTEFAGNLALGAVNDIDLTEAVAKSIGLELAAVGINVDFAPVADVVTQPNNPSLGVRSFGSDPATVAEHVRAFVSGLRQAGIAGSLKHFPGKGEARVDPHYELPVLDLSRQRLDTVELVPFRAGIAAGAEMIMSGHYALPFLTGRDDLPGTVATEAMTGLIRDELGFDGVVVTDALDMGALKQNGGAPAIEAIAALRAGIDLLLCGADFQRAKQLFESLRLAVSRRLLDPEALANSRERIDALRQRVTMMDQPELEVVGTSEHAALASQLARRAVTLVRDEAGLVPIGSEADLLVVMPRPIDLTPADTSSSVEAGLGAAMKRHWPAARSMVVGHHPNPAEIQELRSEAARADLVVVGTITANEQQSRMVSAVAEIAPTIAVALRTPFDLVSYPEVGTYLCTYSILPPSLEALADVLAGKQPAPGRLPVSVGDHYPAGHGLVEV